MKRVLSFRQCLRLESVDDLSIGLNRKQASPEIRKHYR